MMVKLPFPLKPDKLLFHIIAGIVVAVILIVIIAIFLNLYTKHNEEIDMPNYIGQNVEKLLNNMDNNDFIFVISDYVYDKSKTEGIVLKQTPRPDEKVKQNRQVYLTVASSEPPKVKMPELKDISLRQAEIMLKALGLNIENIIYKPSQFENAVLQQLYKGRAIAAGTEIRIGDNVSLVVGTNVNISDMNDDIDYEIDQSFDY